MMTVEKLEQVGEALQALTHAELLIGRLADDEPTSQPPTKRRVELGRIADQLAAQRETIAGLWS